eukprot:SAG11_NODE_3132_length_2664_cov_1.502924_5_plen_209_part_00
MADVEGHGGGLDAIVRTHRTAFDKYLCWLLRHGAPGEGLAVGAGGAVDLEALFALPSARRFRRRYGDGAGGRAALRELVGWSRSLQNGEPRYELLEPAGSAPGMAGGGDAAGARVSLRARYGHSFDVPTEVALLQPAAESTAGAGGGIPSLRHQCLELIADLVAKGKCQQVACIDEDSRDAILALLRRRGKLSNKTVRRGGLRARAQV